MLRRLLAAAVLPAVFLLPRPGLTQSAGFRDQTGPRFHAGRDSLTDRGTMVRPAVVGLIRSDHPRLSRPVAADQPLDQDQVEDMVRAAVREAGGLEQVLDPEARIVALKTNLVEVKESGDGTITDWRVVRAVARLVHETAPGARVKVVESCNWHERGAERWKEDGWALAGYDQLLPEGYVELVNMNLDSSYAKTIPGGGLTRKDLPYPVTMDSVDCLIDLPVVKIIGVVGLTAAMKNLVGMVPNTEAVHRMQVINHSYAHLDEAIVDLNLLHRVDFVVADAIVGLERAKTTTWDGQAVRLNTVLASADVVAADAVAARLIGLNPDDIGYLELAERLGVGVANLEDIQVRGYDPAQVIRRFEKMKSIYDRYGQTPHDWVLKGPFPADGPEQDFLEPRGLAVVPGADGWSEPMYFPTDQIDLRKQYGQPRDCVVYAYTEFTAPRAEPAELWVGSGEAMAVWIDDEQVYRFQGSRRHRAPNDQQPIRLSAGRHRLLVKVYQTIGAFDFSLNICEAQSDPRYSGNRVAGLRFALPGDATAPVPRSGSPQAGERFDIRDWATARTFALTIEDVLDSKAGLPADGISRLAFDPSGRLWVGTDKGVYRRDGDTTWTVYGEAQGVRPGWVDALLGNPIDGHVWAIARGKLHHYDGQSWRLCFPDNWHGNLFLDSRGRTCASVWMNGVRCYDQGRWISYRQHEEGNDFANWTETGQTDRDGNLWVGTSGYGVWRYDGSDWTQYTVRQGLADNHVSRIRAAPNGDLWAAFYASGISRLNRGRWESYFGDGAPTLEIQALLVARSGTVWAATGGLFPTLSRFDGRHWATATIDGNVLDMVEDREGRIWLATGNAVVAARLE